MLPAVACAAFFAIVPVFSAPITSLHTPRGLGTDIGLAASRFGEDVVQPVKNAVKIALSRISPAVKDAIAQVSTEAGFFQVTESQADDLIRAADRGDIQAIRALDNAVRRFAAVDVPESEISDGAWAIFKKYNVIWDDEGEKVIKVTIPFKNNKVQVAAENAMTKITSWEMGGLTTKQKWALATAGAGVATGSVLVAALGIAAVAGDDHPALPDELDEDDMAKLEAYIGEHPDQYGALMSDIKANVPGITQEQIEELTSAAPQEFQESVVADESSTSNEDLD